MRSAFFDPRGCDLQVEGSWTIEGNAPDANSCDTIAQAEAIIWDQDLEESFRNSALRVSCEDGVLDTSNNEDRCNGTGERLEAGIYYVQWIATAENGSIIDCAEPVLYDASMPDSLPTPGVLELNPVDFTIHPPSVSCP